MRLKLITLVVFGTALGCVLLGLRQRKLRLMHEMARMYIRMNHSREQTWDTQVRIAEGVQPRALRQAIARSKLRLESITPTDPRAAGWPTPVADAASASRR